LKFPQVPCRHGFSESAAIVEIPETVRVALRIATNHGDERERK
jgi:hypothetical protein